VRRGAYIGGPSPSAGPGGTAVESAGAGGGAVSADLDVQDLTRHHRKVAGDLRRGSARAAAAATVAADGVDVDRGDARRDRERLVAAGIGEAFRGRVADLDPGLAAWGGHDHAPTRWSERRAAAPAASTNGVATAPAATTPQAAPAATTVRFAVASGPAFAE